MSINVNVTGNPISIKGRKVVTADQNFDNGEFQKRRCIRIQQVRQQSKDIAENVRNKVRKEKIKQLSEVEKQGEKELKKWQARKLVALQQQYNDCLKDIGLGHAQASLEEESDELLLMGKDSNEKIMKERGVEAMQKLKKKIEKDKKDRLERIEKRKYHKAVENTRSAMVVSLQKQQSPIKKKKKISTNIDIVVSDTESEPEVPVNTRRFSTSDISIPVNDDIDITQRGTQVDLPESSNVERDSETITSLVYPLDTRISDRIKRRRLKCVNCDPVSSKIGSLNSEPKKIQMQESPKKELPVKELFKYDHERYLHPVTLLQTDLPSKPPLRVRTTTRTEAPSTGGIKVQYYDHPNRFTKEYEFPLSSVHRVSDGSIEVCPSVGSEAEYVEEMYKRDRDAQIRGQRAMEKVKVRRDYNEMIDQLSKLQKKERIASISPRKPQVHISQERSKEYERKRQNHLENAYEKLFPVAQVVTIPPRSPSPSSNATKQQIPRANFGVWGFDSKRDRKSPPRETPKVVSADKDSFKRTEDLKKMLHSLTEQRDKVAKEIKSLPKTSKLHQIFGDLTCIDQILERGRALNNVSRLPMQQSLPQQGTRMQASHSQQSSQIQPSRPQQSGRTQPSRLQQGGNMQQPHPQQGGSSKMKDQDKRNAHSPERHVNTKMLSPKEKLNTHSPRQQTRSKTPPKKSKEVSQSVSTQTTTADAETETVPLKSDKAVNTSIRKDSTKTGKCKCTKSREKDQCEIIIKICDRTDNQQKPPTSQLSALEQKSNFERQQVKPDLGKRKGGEQMKLSINTNDKKKASWRDILIQNTSTSTSYCSPPEFQPVTHKKQPLAQSTEKKSFKDILKDIPQQHNIFNDSISSANTTKTKVALQDHIKRLLAMSRGSIEDLTISTISDVSTPATSIVQIESNNPQDSLLIKQFNSNKSEQYPSNSPQVTPIHSLKVADIGCQCVNDYAAENYPEVLTTYNKMAENYVKKIENLSSMIAQVRLEKRDMLERPISGSDKEDSTKYLDLPSDRDNSLSPKSAQQEQLTKNLLQIDFNYDEQLKQKKPQGVLKSPELDTTNQDLMKRFKKLTEDDIIDQESPPDTLWLNIPKLPKFEENHNRTPTVSKPPPSRGITVAMRHHQDINILPHELSVIQEVDSFTSNKPQSVVSKEQSLQKDSKDDVENKSCQIDYKDSSSSISLPDILSEIDAINGQKVSQEDSSEKSSSNKSGATISILSNSSSNDIDIETTLKSLGMGWAVATLKKTQQALALTSTSSSSMDISLKHQSADTSKLNGSSSILSTFLQGLVVDPNSTSSGNKTSRKTSTPVQNFEQETFVNNSQTNILLTAESDISSIRRSSNDPTSDFVQFYSLNEGSLNQSKDVN